MQWATKIKELLQDGLYVHNLRRIEDVAWEAVKSDQSTCPAYVIYQISRGIADVWDDEPLSVTEATRVEDIVRPSMEAVLNAVLSNASRADIMTSVEDLIKKRIDTL